MQQDIKCGDTIRLVVAGTVRGVNVITLQSFDTEVLQVLPKSLRIAFAGGNSRSTRLWLPRRALVQIRREGRVVHARLAAWSTLRV